MLGSRYPLLSKAQKIVVSQVVSPRVVEVRFGNKSWDKILKPRITACDFMVASIAPSLASTFLLRSFLHLPPFHFSLSLRQGRTSTRVTCFDDGSVQRDTVFCLGL